MQDPNNRQAFKRPNGSWIVVDYSFGLNVLDLHKEGKAFDLSAETTKSISIAEEKNYNAGYFYLRNQELERSLILLLPGYVVFTSAGNKRFKMSILESNKQLLFSWEEFGSDTSYIKKNTQAVEKIAFHYVLKKYGLHSNNSIQSVLGLNISELVNKLQLLVHEKFPSQYPTNFGEQDLVIENSKLINAKKKEETLRRSLKREQEKIDLILKDNNYDENNNNNILYRIQVEFDGKVLSPKKTQALILRSAEYKQTIYSQNKTIKNLKEKITSAKKHDDIITINAEIQKLVEKEIEEKKLGSTIFMSTSQYLSILLSLPCTNCLDIIVSNKTFYTKVLGFGISCVIKCLLCKTSTEY